MKEDDGYKPDVEVHPVHHDLCANVSHWFHSHAVSDTSDYEELIQSF